mgnify:CR=1 FL=1
MINIKLDEVDKQILDILIDNARTPYTDIAKTLIISPGTVHVRVKKMEDAGVIKGSSLVLYFDKLGYPFIAHVGIFVNNTRDINRVLKEINEIPFVTVASIVSGSFNIFCKIRAIDSKHARELIFQIENVEGVYRSETMITLEECINDKKRLMHTILKDL